MASEIVACLKAYCPSTGRCTAHVTLFSDGSVKLDGDQSLARSALLRLANADIAERDPAPINRLDLLAAVGEKVQAVDLALRHVRTRFTP